MSKREMVTTQKNGCDTSGRTVEESCTEMLQSLQRRMARRTRSGRSRWTDQEFADLCRIYLKWYRKEE